MLTLLPDDPESRDHISLSLFKLGVEAGFHLTFLFKDLCFVKWVLL